MKTIALSLAVAIAVLAAAAPASAATKTYGGTAAIGGKVAIDVKFGKKGAPKRITELRAVDLPATCEISGPGIPLDAETAVSIKVSSEGTFEFELTDAYGQKSILEGKFSGKKSKRVKGSFTYAGHFPAEGPYPEENCTTGETSYTLKKGGPDAVPVARPAR